MSQTDFLFQQDTALTWAQDPAPEINNQQPWWVLIVDDDESIHQVTSLVLRGFSFEGRPVQLLHAYSAKEARRMLELQQNIAVAIVDVVMETNHAGLDLIKAIRGELQQHQIRLILRTGQPGGSTGRKCDPRLRYQRLQKQNRSHRH